MSISRLGNGKSSLGQVKSLNSMQIRIWPFFFLIDTIFANQTTCLDSLMNPTSNSFLICNWIALLKFLATCLTSLIVGFIASLCVINLLSKPGISSYIQEKIYLYSYSNSIRFPSNSTSNPSTTKVAFSSLSTAKLNFFNFP